MSKFTPWFSGDQKPARVGVYQRKYKRDRIVYCLWNGYSFGCGWNSVRATESDARLQTNFPDLPWRGLTKEQT